MFAKSANGKSKFTIVSTLILLVAGMSRAQTAEQLAEEKQLQQLYPGYRGVSPDYLHAGKEAIEKFQDLKYGLRIHWGIYSIWEVEASLLLSRESELSASQSSMASGPFDRGQSEKESPESPHQRSSLMCRSEGDH